MIPFPKVSLGVRQKHYDHPLSHTVNTTYDWGRIQPTLSLYMMADSTVSGSFRDFVRLAPLPVPTFARMYHENDIVFVNVSDVVPYNDAMLANQPYYGNKSYYPKTLPYTTSVALMCAILSNARYVTYRVMKNSSESNYSYMSFDDAVSSYSTLNSVYLNVAAGSSAPSVFKTHYPLPKPVQSNIASNTNWTYNDNITYDSADYIVKSGSYLFLFRYTGDGRALRKVLLGLGYSLQLGDLTPVSLVPILAFYKAYFDRYEVKRVLSWPMTNCYQLIKYIDDNYQVDFSLQGLGGDNAHAPYTTLFDKLLYDLSQLWYVAPVDYVSAQTSTPVVSPETYTSPDFQGNLVSSFNNEDGSLPSVSEGTLLDRVVLKGLAHVTRYVNKDSILGSKIQDYLRVHYGADVVNNLFKEVNHVGNYRTDCSINDIYSTTENATSDAEDPRSGDFLGSYAGKGLGYRENTIKFHAKANGYLFCLSCIVPESNFFQGNDTSLLPLDVNSIPCPEYDCCGFEVEPRSIIYAGNDFYNGGTTAGEGFGYMPRYSCYKYKKSIVNGDMSRRGTIDSLSPYYTDRIISDLSIVGDSSDPSNIKLEFVGATVPNASTEWRYVTKWKYLGNFNRIFYNSGNVSKGSYSEQVLNDVLNPVDDNFIGQMYWLLKVNNTLMPLGMSYDTFDKEEDTGTISVSKD